MSTAQNRWAALNVEQNREEEDLESISSLNTRRKKGARAKKWFGLLMKKTFTPVLFVLCIVFLALYITEKESSHVANIITVEENGLAFLADPGHDPFEDFQINQDYQGRSRMARSGGNIAVTDNGQCSEMSIKVMEENGTAIDAMVTAALCIGLRNPLSSGIGGGSFILVYLANGTSKVIDGKEWAPKDSTKRMFKNQGSIASRIGGKSVAIPLEMKALYKMWDLYGTQKWKSLVDRVIPLARDGFDAHPFLLSELKFNVRPEMQVVFEAMRDAFLIKDNGVWRLPRVGETCCKRPALAKTLELLANSSADDLYKSDWGDRLVEDIQNHVYPGNITKEDLIKAHPIVRDPIRAKVLGMEMLTMTPTSSAVTLIPALKLLDAYDDFNDTNALTEHRIVEAMKHMFAIRSHIGDPGTDEELPPNYQEFIANITSDEFAEILRESTNDEKTNEDLSQYGGPYTLESEVQLDAGTSHLCIVDREGNAVSLTTSVNFEFGSYVISPQTGVLLNDLMDDFYKPGVIGRLPLIPPSRNNHIGPWKRPLSSMSPTILLKDGKLKMVIGASGGPGILTSILQVLVNYFKRGYDLNAAIQKPRLHDHLVNITYYENGIHGDSRLTISESIQSQLKAKGHKLEQTKFRSNVLAIEITENGTRVGVADPRKDGAAVGSP